MGEKERRVRCVASLVALCSVTVSAGLAWAEYGVSESSRPTMRVEQVEMIAQHLVASSIDDSRGKLPVISVRATRADRLGAVPNERAGVDTRTIWVVEVQGEAGADGAFYVIDDETGAVLAHGVVAAPRAHGAGDD